MSEEQSQRDQPESGPVAKPTDKASPSHSFINVETLESTSLTLPIEDTPTVTTPTIQPSDSPDQSDSRTFTCTYPECYGLSFEKNARLNEHIKRKHNRPFKCAQCHFRFGSASDRDRHVRTLHQGTPGNASPPAERTWVCQEVSCRRKGKPFSRRDNYVKHLREVHGARVRAPEVDSSDRSRSNDQVEDVTRSVAETAVAAASRNQGGRKRKAGDFEEELEELPPGELVRLVLSERDKVRRLEEDLRDFRRRCEEREDLG